MTSNPFSCPIDVTKFDVIDDAARFAPVFIEIILSSLKNEHSFCGLLYMSGVVTYTEFYSKLDE